MKISDAARIRRFYTKFGISRSGCWIWLGEVDRKGYGRMQVDGRRIGSHRFSYEAFVGHVPSGMLVCHRCDVPACVNPAHLFIASNDENMADMVSKRRARQGERHHRAKLTEANALTIRHSHEGYKTLAKRYGVAPTTIRRIKKGLCWKFAGNPSCSEAEPA